MGMSSFADGPTRKINHFVISNLQWACKLAICITCCAQEYVMRLIKARCLICGSIMACNSTWNSRGMHTIVETKIPLMEQHHQTVYQLTTTKQ
jgi:hypothetical protein